MRSKALIFNQVDAVGKPTEGRRSLAVRDSEPVAIKNP
jgi:hypothetical protein